MNTFLIRALVLTLEKFAMKKTLIALAALAVSGAAFAQSSVTLYGVLDAGIVNDGTDTKFVSGVTSGPRLGVRGTEDLGGGLKASFTIETGLNNGKEAATSLGDRGAHISVSGGFGTVQIGSSVLSPSFFARASSDASTANNYSIATYGGAARNDNSINYSNTIGGLTIRAAMVMKADNGGNGATDFSVVYAAGPLTLAASSADNGAAEGKGSYIGASYNLGAAKVFLSSVDTDASGKTTNVGVSAPMGALTLQADYRMVKDTDVNTYVLSAQYALSKRSSLTAYTSKADDADGKVGFGIRHTF
jgi:predicted porin